MRLTEIRWQLQDDGMHDMNINGYKMVTLYRPFFHHISRIVGNEEVDISVYTDRKREDFYFSNALCKINGEIPLFTWTRNLQMHTNLISARETWFWGSRGRTDAKYFPWQVIPQSSSHSIFCFIIHRSCCPKHRFVVFTLAGSERSVNELQGLNICCLLTSFRP